MQLILLCKESVIMKIVSSIVIVISLFSLSSFAQDNSSSVKEEMDHPTNNVSSEERERLLEKLKKEWAKSKRGKTTEFLALSTKDPLKKKYYLAVMEKLNSPLNKKSNQNIVNTQGKTSLIVSLELDDLGNLKSVHIDKPSEHDSVNKYVLSMIKESQPFPKYEPNTFSENIKSVVIITAIHYQK